MYTHQDIQSGLLMQPHRAGMQLVKPTQNQGSLCLSADLYSSSMSVYFMSGLSRVISVNESGAELNGDDSTKDIIGKDAHDVWDSASANLMQRNDRLVMQREIIQITDDSATRSVDANSIEMITFKMPWYHADKIIGVFGFTLQLDLRSLSSFAANLSTILASGLLRSNQLALLQRVAKPKSGEVYFSKREQDVLVLLVQGKTAKQIAYQLYISKRTVEHHIENIKLKSGCNSKFSIIDKYHWKIMNN